LKFLKKFNSIKLFKIKKNSQHYLINKKNYLINNSSLDVFLKFIFKSGLKKYSKISLLKSFNYIFFIFQKNNIFWDGFKSQIEILKQSFFKDINNFNVNFILLWLYNFLNPIFDMVCYEVPKKYKKKLKKNYFFKLKYNYFNTRKKIAYKWIYKYSNNFDDRKFSKRLLKSLFFTFIQGKNSYLYTKKIHIYTKFLQRK
jgi:hypothetical protein